GDEMSQSVALPTEEIGDDRARHELEGLTERRLAGSFLFAREEAFWFPENAEEPLAASGGRATANCPRLNARYLTGADSFGITLENHRDSSHLAHCIQGLFGTKPTHHGMGVIHFVID